MDLQRREVMLLHVVNLYQTPCGTIFWYGKGHSAVIFSEVTASMHPSRVAVVFQLTSSFFSDAPAFLLGPTTPPTHLVIRLAQVRMCENGSRQ